MANAIVVDQLTFSYKQATTKTLTDVSLTVPTGSFNLLVGPSGAGKSTLFKLLAGLYPAFAGVLETGTISLFDQSLATLPDTKRSSLVAMMFQNPNQQFAMDTVMNEVRFALENQETLATEIDKRALDALDFVGISDLKDRILDTLSGGEKQKVALAVIVAMDSQLILLDEPFASVDPEARELLLNRLVTLQQDQHKTIFIADHDLTGYASLVDQTWQLHAQQVQPLSVQSAQALFEAFETDRQHPIKTPVPGAAVPADLITDAVSVSAGDRRLLTDISLRIPAHKITLISGPNGTGKSTLFGALSKTHDYTGDIMYQQRAIKKIRLNKYAQQVGLVFQDAETQFLLVTVEEELQFAIKHTQDARFNDEWVNETLTALNLTQHREQIIYSLSEGQKKKLQLILMIMTGTPTLLLDEPFSGLDRTSLTTMATLLKAEVTNHQRTLLVISHQTSGLTDFFDYHLNVADQHLQFVSEVVL